MSEKPSECSSCGFETSDLEYSEGPYDPDTPNHRKEGAWLCVFCRESLAGNAFWYPSNYGEDAVVLQTIASVGNILLRELRKKQ